MDEDGIPVSLSVVAALVVGLTGVLLFALLRFCRGRADAGTGSSEPHSPVDTCSENEKESVSTKPVKTKALKHPKPNRKSLPNHPLLVCEFKGHTGSILSLDFDCSQKYLASCSEGILVACRVLIVQTIRYRSFCETVVYETSQGEGTQASFCVCLWNSFKDALIP